MRSIAIPFQIVKGGLARTEDTKKAIDQSLALLMTTPCFSCAADPLYGFIFNNLRFEIVNEKEGVVMNSALGKDLLEARLGLYDKKISGSSNNLNTFAAELKQTIQLYEPRLRDVSVSMTYMREERKIYVTVKGVQVENGAPYQNSSIINVWK